MHRFAWIVAIALSFAGHASAQPNVSEVQRLVGPGDDGEFAGSAAAISGNTAVMGAVLHTDDESQQGAAYVFERDPATNAWSFVKKLVASDAGFDNFFGFSVAIDGDRIVVGAPGNDVVFQLDAGAAYVFERDAGGAGNWGEVAQLFGSVAGGATGFGTAVDVRGNTIVAGEPTTDGVGNVFVFTGDPFGVWVETKRLSPPDDFVRFGQSLALDGDRLLVGAPRRPPDHPGFAYLHERNQGGAGNWGIVRTFSFSFADEDEVAFGAGVALHGDTAAVSDPGSGNLGRDNGLVEVFQRDQDGPNAWGQVVRLFGENSDDNFGQDLALRGDRLLVGSRDANAAYTFGRNQGGPNAWGALQKLVPSDPDFSGFGRAVGLTGGGVLGENAIIGAPEGDTGNLNQGFAYIFGNTRPRPVLGDVSGAIGGGNAVVLIGSIEDGEQGAETLIARVNGAESATVNGVTVSNLAIGADGAVTAEVDVACGASDASFELSFADESGEVATASLTIEAAPSEPPVLEVRPPLTLLLPLHLHHLVSVRRIVTAAADDCDGDVSADVVIEQITSDEPDDAPGLADGFTRHDVIVLDCRTALVRAERSLLGNGRVYGVTLRVDDSEGNTSRAVYRVRVPRLPRPLVEDAPALVVPGCP